MPGQDLTSALCSPQVKPRTPRSLSHLAINALFAPPTASPGMTLPWQQCHLFMKSLVKAGGRIHIFPFLFASVFPQSTTMWHAQQQPPSRSRAAPQNNSNPGKRPGRDRSVRWRKESRRRTRSSHADSECILESPNRRVEVLCSRFGWELWLLFTSCWENSRIIKITYSTRCFIVNHLQG